MNSNDFNNGIISMIALHSYDIYLLNKVDGIKCSCTNHATKQADSSCEKCLGTGTKIMIRKVKVAAQDSRLPPTFRSDNFIVGRNYFIPSKYMIAENDMLIDNDEVYMIFEIQNLIGLEGTIPYKKASSVKKRFESKMFINNFYKLLKIETKPKPIIKPIIPPTDDITDELIVVTKNGQEIIYSSIKKEEVN